MLLQHFLIEDKLRKTTPRIARLAIETFHRQLLWVSISGFSLRSRGPSDNEPSHFSSFAYPILRAAAARKTGNCTYSDCGKMCYWLVTSQAYNTLSVCRRCRFFFRFGDNGNRLACLGAFFLSSIVSLKTACCVLEKKTQWSCFKWNEILKILIYRESHEDDALCRPKWKYSCEEFVVWPTAEDKILPRLRSCESFSISILFAMLASQWTSRLQQPLNTRAHINLPEKGSQQRRWRGKIRVNLVCGSFRLKSIRLCIYPTHYRDRTRFHCGSGLNNSQKTLRWFSRQLARKRFMASTSKL